MIIDTTVVQHKKKDVKRLVEPQKKSYVENNNEVSVAML